MALLSNLAEQIHSCTRCGACLAVCPSFQATGDESNAPRGRVNLLRAWTSGRLKPANGLADRLSRCLECRACTEVCPSGVEPQQIIQAAKKEFVGEGGSCRLAHVAALFLTSSEDKVPMGLRLASGLKSLLLAPPLGLFPGLHEGQLSELPEPGRKSLTELLPEVSPAAKATTRVVFFAGCATNIFFPDSGLAAAAILTSAGAEVITPRGLKCCGQPLLWLGDEESARDMARENLRRLSMLDADAVITICPSCALGLKEEIPRLMGGIPEARRLAGKVMDIHQFLAGRNQYRKEKPWMPGLTQQNHTGEKQEITVTWHDPCHLRYGLGVKAEPREIISSAPGVRYVETAGEHNCCGAGGLFSLIHFDLALEIGRRKAEEIALSGADVVATGCPACRAHLTGVFARAGVDAKVVHTVELLNKQPT